jgi:hypothetical protein
MTQSEALKVIVSIATTSKSSHEESLRLTTILLSGEVLVPHFILDSLYLLQDEQFMYPSSPENESFIVSLVNCQRQGYGICRQGIIQDQEADAIRWEITRALRCE